MFKPLIVVLFLYATTALAQTPDFKIGDDVLVRKPLIVRGEDTDPRINLYTPKVYYLVGAVLSYYRATIISVDDTTGKFTVKFKPGEGAEKEISEERPSNIFKKVDRLRGITAGKKIDKKAVIFGLGDWATPTKIKGGPLEVAEVYSNGVVFLKENGTLTQAYRPSLSEQCSNFLARSITPKPSNSVSRETTY